MELPLATLPTALLEVLNGRQIDPEAHVTPEMFAKLKTFIDVGIPRDWMIDIMSDGDGMELAELPPEFLITYELLVDSFKQLAQNSSAMTELANTGNPKLAKDRKEYQDNELNIMRLVIDSIKDKLNDPESTKLILALRGAKFFESLLTGYAGSTLEVEAKRIMLKKKDTELGSPFIVGLADIVKPTEEEANKIRTLLLPDDCLSTGMTQMAVLEQLFIKGYRPENVVMVFTVGTLAGINYMYEKFNDLIDEYGLKTKLILQCGGLCYKVNDKMYLQTEEGLFKVGDMGDFNEAVVTGITSSVDPGSVVIPADIQPDLFVDIGPGLAPSSDIPAWTPPEES